MGRIVDDPDRHNPTRSIALNPAYRIDLQHPALRHSGAICETGLSMRRTPYLLLLACSSAAWPQNAGLPSRESLSYNIEWRLITAGKARLDWAAVPEPQAGWQVRFHLESIGLVSKLFKVEDDYTALLNQALCVQSSGMTSHEGSRQRETKVSFVAAAKRASYLERDRVKNNVVLAREIDIPDCVHDVIGGVYHLRTLSLDPGQSTQVSVSDGKKSVMAKIEAQQREDVKTPAGTFKTVRYEIFLFNNVLYSRSARLYVWLTDDRRKLPVQIRARMPITVGTLTLLLEKYE